MQGSVLGLVGIYRCKNSLPMKELIERKGKRQAKLICNTQLGGTKREREQSPGGTLKRDQANSTGSWR